MSFDYEAATKARDTFNEQVARFTSEAAAYRDQAARAESVDERHSCLSAAKTLDAQAEQVGKLANDMQQQMVDARSRAASLTFEESMAAARKRGKMRSRGEESNELE